MKNYDKNTTSSYLMYLDANNLYGSTMSQKLPVNGFEWVEELSQFNENSPTNYDENSNEGIFLTSILNIQKSCLIVIVIYNFYL